MKHGNSAIPEEIGNDDARLNAYLQTLIWRMQTCGCPYLDALQLCRDFRGFALDQKVLVFRHGLHKPKPAKSVYVDMPELTYCEDIGGLVDEGEDVEVEGESKRC